MPVTLVNDPLEYWHAAVGQFWTPANGIDRSMTPISTWPDWMARNLGVQKAK